MTNSIVRLQNEESALRLLRARSQIYQQATRLLLLQIVFVIVVPVISAVSALVWPRIGPYTAFASLLIAVTDAAVLDRFQRRKIKLAAKVSEEFDCEVLGIPWNKMVAGHRADPEQIVAADVAWRGSNDKLRDWYPTEISESSPRIARVVCQRTNAWYDSNLRQGYVLWVLGFVCTVFVGCLVAGLWNSLSVPDLITMILTPAAPALIWCLRELYRHKDVIDASETAKAEIESLCTKMLSADLTEIECIHLSREIQNGIFVRRSSSPLLLPFIYRWRRRKMEIGMRAGATQLLTRFRSEEVKRGQTN